ncbi:MmcQ/YjbR family DNA-binding protein [Sphingomonas sp. NFR15]|uniref:MmcQ/YjbR family DNA-binding protein n=1 Tax=Sphingomonas sp. NFR15 TaxID=1566282 RepID=UPI000890B053|nr:MmcQ/YjbR family DNA-binding protein [Sphingomonas sp. NFR15]SDA19543.1 Predicted DNA-binding protein, MmcQ/YjbR family [Sphingomonas sp. NFR15]
MSPDPEAALARVRAYCLALPEAEEKISHGAPGFLIAGGKFFAYFWHNHHNDGETVAIVRTTGHDEQQMLIESGPAFYYAPPYLAPFGWVAMRLDGADLDWDRVGDRIAASWELAAPERLLEAGGR